VLLHFEMLVSVVGIVTIARPAVQPVLQVRHGQVLPEYSGSDESDGKSTSTFDLTCGQIT
jgi:hypothetical protein